MRKILAYSSFALTGTLMVLMFMTATNFMQLGAAVILYPLFIYFAYEIFKGNGISATKYTSSELPRTKSASVQTIDDKTKVQVEKVVADIDKRAFLKLIGATGISYLLFSILGNRAESLIFKQKQIGSALWGGNDADGQINANTESLFTKDYLISEIDDTGVYAYYGFTKSNGSWFIMRGDQGTGSFRYIKGDSEFEKNWEMRDSLKYDYFHKSF